ncbi:MAG TPA: IPTL-CTERM sorting domain-containing protein, partial [Leucothrix sp.]|nr:IPTL-CTERM sorting domain-containing protein [Leucothrix sp.]
VPDSKDLDAGNDGILDILEAGGIDADHDGMVNNADDADNDGLADVADADDANADSPVDAVAGIAAMTAPPTNTDGVGSPDFQQIDSDGDGINDLVEAGIDPAVNDTNGDGMIDTTPDADANGIVEGVNDNGIPTIVDPATGTPAAVPDADDDGTPDYQDLDSDGDGNSDATDPTPGEPVAVDDVGTVQSGGSVVINILNNDDFPAGPNITITDTGNGTAVGDVSFDPVKGEMTYTAAQGEVGVVTVEYEVCNTASNPTVCSVALASINIGAVNVPTLSEWMLMMLTMLLGFVGWKESKGPRIKKK